eukprot:TRINITY_DN2453_c0_g1_i3.p1 TRINITY_DN2453_c0_g1~~TRINITY_DN2453_c0_g1_i3.p1  ORF type:complete len:643 (-),score=123.04 TRINITY_DN2453_c0_g1_i3:355-2283(-)
MEEGEKIDARTGKCKAKPIPLSASHASVIEGAITLWRIDNTSNGAKQAFHDGAADLQNRIAAFPDEEARERLGDVLQTMKKSYNVKCPLAWRKYVPDILRHTGLEWVEVRSVLDLLGKKSTPSTPSAGNEGDEDAGKVGKTSKRSTSSSTGTMKPKVAKRIASVVRMKSEPGVNSCGESAAKGSKRRLPEKQLVVKHEKRARKSPPAALVSPAPLGTKRPPGRSARATPGSSVSVPSPESLVSTCPEDQAEAALIEAQVMLIDQVFEDPWTVCYGSLGSGVVGVRSKTAPPLDAGRNFPATLAADEYPEGVSGVDSRGRLPTDATVVLFVSARELWRNAMRRLGDADQDGAEGEGCEQDLNLQRKTLVWTGAKKDRCNRITRTLQRHTNLGGRCVVGVRDGVASLASSSGVAPAIPAFATGTSARGAGAAAASGALKSSSSKALVGADGKTVSPASGVGAGRRRAAETPSASPLVRSAAKTAEVVGFEVYHLLGNVQSVVNPTDSQFLVNPGDSVIMEQGTRVFHKAISIACLSDVLRTGVGLTSVRYPFSGPNKEVCPRFCPMCCYQASSCTLHLDDIQTEGGKCFWRARPRRPFEVKEEAEEKDSSKGLGVQSQSVVKLERRLGYKQTVKMDQLVPLANA